MTIEEKREALMRNLAALTPRERERFKQCMDEVANGRPFYDAMAECRRDLGIPTRH